MDIVTLFSGVKEREVFDYDSIKSDIFVDESHYIDNLSPYENNKEKKDKILRSYYRSIMLGYNHIFIEKIMDTNNNKGNIALPILHKWEGEERIDTLVIISNSEDSGRIAKGHIKKAPIFKDLLYDSLISTTDNDF